MNIQDALSLAIQNYDNKQFIVAESYLNDILKSESENIQALHLLAIIHAIRSNEKECIRLFDKVLEIIPDSVPILKDYAKALTDLKLNERALIFFQKAIKKLPSDIDLRFNHSICLANLGRFNDSIVELNELLRIAPDYFPALVVRSSIYVEQKEFFLALQDLDRAISISNDFYDGYLNRAFINRALNRHESALLDLDDAIAIDPKNPIAYSHKGVLLHEIKQDQQALVVLDKATEIDSNHIGGWLNKGIVLQALGRMEDALDSYNQVLSIDINNSDALANKASCLNILGDPSLGLQCAEKAIELNPLSFNAWLNKGSSLKNLNKPTLALAAYDNALEIQPDSSIAIWNKSLVNLAVGNYETGFKEYEYRWRWEGADPYRYKDKPQLSSISEIRGKKILCWYEQGYGDTFQFIRYIGLLKELGANEIILEVQPPLTELLSCLDCRFFVQGESLSEIDFQVPLGSLPFIFKTTIETIPNQFPYLTVNENSVETWKDLTKFTDGKLNLGITCSGNLNFDRKNGNPRYLPLKNLIPFIDIANLYLLQTALVPADEILLEQHPEIIWPGEKIKNFEDTAAIIMNMNAVISIDTSVAHLSGALGKKTFVLLPWASDWRWFLDKEYSPWYPDVKLYRQSKPMDWIEPIKALRADLDS